MSEPKCTKLKDAKTIVDDETLSNWVEQHAQANKLQYLLAHAEDGVIWGYFDENKLITANSEFPQCTKFRQNTLQQCRIFCADAEILLWRTEQEWNARIVEEVADLEPIIESQVLWGTKIKAQKGNFTLVYDGKQGLEHAVPLSNISAKFEVVNQPKKHPLRLDVHHYFKYSDEGLAYIYLSRLVNLRVV